MTDSTDIVMDKTDTGVGSSEHTINDEHERFKEEIISKYIKPYSQENNNLVDHTQFSENFKQAMNNLSSTHLVRESQIKEEIKDMKHKI